VNPGSHSYLLSDELVSPVGELVGLSPFLSSDHFDMRPLLSHALHIISQLERVEEKRNIQYRIHNTS
jgi:hypothetical protein